MSMSELRESSLEEDKRFISRSFSSNDEFLAEFKKIYVEKSRRTGLRFEVLTELEEVVSAGKVDCLKKLKKFMEYLLADAESLSSCGSDEIRIKYFNPIILASKYARINVLKYLFEGNNCKTLSSFAFGDQYAFLPDFVDETCHSAFYYAVRSCDVELLALLINRWPGDYFSGRDEELDEILACAYDELRLKNVPLSEEMEIYVENKLVDLRFFSTEHKQILKFNTNHVRERMKLVVESVFSLNARYTSATKVDENFLFLARFIAHNVHVLKRQYKQSYDRLPWEEIEFCLISFISSKTKQLEINMFYQAVLSTTKILKYLENFAKKLEAEIINLEHNATNKNKFSEIPPLKREKVMADIINRNPEFEELYKDYQQIRDIVSLEKINEYLKLASISDPMEREGKIIITRVLQVIGEYLKNTLESPKLSSTTSELILLSLPRDTRAVLMDLRNSLSHAYSLSQRAEIEENSDSNFFTGVYNDTKKIGSVISNILYHYKIKTTGILLQEIMDSENLNEIKEVADTLQNAELQEMIAGDFVTTEQEELEKLVGELDGILKDKPVPVQHEFMKINHLIKQEADQKRDIKTRFTASFLLLKNLNVTGLMSDQKIEQNMARGLRYFAKEALSNFAGGEINTNSIRELTESVTRICVFSGEEDENVKRIASEIFCVAQFHTGDIKWIEELRGKLNENSSFLPSRSRKHTLSNLMEKKCNEQLASKISELEFILKTRGMRGVAENFPCYKKNKKLQAVVEMLVLDIMSILGVTNKLSENNLCYLDDHSPLPIGKTLRNYLAHDNALMHIFPFNSSVSVLLNAEKLISENVVKSKKKFGKLVGDNPKKLRDKFEKSLAVVSSQEKMFQSLVEGNVADLKSCLKMGADVHGRSVNLWTALHFAAKGSGLEVVKYLISQNLNPKLKDFNGQSPLHVAAAFGRGCIIHFLIGSIGLLVDDRDNQGKTPLHLASLYGHIDAVRILLKNRASSSIQDTNGVSPLHYAIRNNHIDVVKALLKNCNSVDLNEAMGGFTPLHVAAETGHLELVFLLLQKNASVNAETDRKATPLHLASLNGHLKIVEVLISNGANVKATVFDGCTPLHYAVENGHEKVAEILLQNGANVNASDVTYNKTPLHYAAQDGHLGIVKILLKFKADTRITTVTDYTPFHLAANSGHLDISLALLDHGIDIEAKDVHNNTALSYAAAKGHLELVKLILKNKASMINARGTNGCTPLHMAAFNGHKNIVEFLINNRADIQARDLEGMRALHAAAINGKKELIDLLIKCKAVVDVKDNLGRTPLHLAAAKGNRDAVVELLKSKANVNAKSNDDYGLTPLHLAVKEGHKDVVNLLINNKAEVNTDCSLILLAVEAGHSEILKILIMNGANVNGKVKNSSYTPLISAMKNNKKDIVEILLANAANVNSENDNIDPLSCAVFAGYTDIVKVLLKNKAKVNVNYQGNGTVLHLAAGRGYKEIVKTLLERGANIDAVTVQNATPLYFAAESGHHEIVQILIENRANMNIRSFEGTPLHIASGLGGHDNVVEVLLKNGANVYIKDMKSRTALELAVAHGHLKIVKLLLQYKNINLNEKCSFDSWTVLHIASQEPSLEMVKFLVSKGCNIHAKNCSGSKPIHIAAREGFLKTVKYFLSTGLSVEEYGMTNQTLLHYAVMEEKMEVVQFLIEQGANVNAKDMKASTPLHVAALHGAKDAAELLINNGAVYNSVDLIGRRPWDRTFNREIKLMLSSTEKMIEAVKGNNSKDVLNYIKAGALVNAKYSDCGTSLHYASWKGYHEVVEVLLKNKANPSIVGVKGFTPLHYASKYSHGKIVKALLSSGAVFDAVSDSGKTPAKLVKEKDITCLFKLIRDAFEKVKIGDIEVVKDLNKIKDTETMVAVMCAHNSENQSLIVAAVQNKFPEVGKLKEVGQGDVVTQLAAASALAGKGDYQRALSIYKRVLEKRKGIFGPDNPGTFDIQRDIAKTLYKQGHYEDSLKILNDIYDKQKEMLGLNAEDTLCTRNFIALVLHRQGKDEEAFEIYQQVCREQIKILGPDHLNSLETQLHMALVLDKLGRYDEALSINQEIFEKKKDTSGENDPFAVLALNNIGMVLANQGKNEEALKIFREVHEKKKSIFGLNHSETLRTLHNIAGILNKQKKYQEALKIFQEVLNLQKIHLGPRHPDYLRTQYNIANMFLSQGKFNAALNAYRECIDQMKAVFGSSHPYVWDIEKKIQAIPTVLNFQNNQEPNPSDQSTNVIAAASKGDIKGLERLVKTGAKVNVKDEEGRSCLHFAVSSGDIGSVQFLLKCGANVTAVSNKGNTPLHTAASKGHKNIADILLQHVSNRDIKNGFVDAKTTTSGSSSLHIAAKAGFLEVVKTLLSHGAMFNIRDKAGQSPSDVAQDKCVTDFLRFLGELFKDARLGDANIIERLMKLNSDEFAAVTNARNIESNTILQTLVGFGHKKVARLFLQMLKKLENN